MPETHEKTPITREAWSKAVRSGETPEDAVLHKQYTVQFNADDQPEDSRLVDFVLNSGKADRHGDIVRGEGWDLENYSKNPVVLWNHNLSAFAGPAPMPHAGLPIARGRDLSTDGDTLLGSAEFYREEGRDISEAAKFIDTIYKMVKGGFLNAVSVGFSPTKWKELWEDDRFTGYEFEEQELLEFSVVPIPADSDALVQAKNLGIDVDPVRDWAVQLLESGDELVVPKKKLVAVVKSLGFGRGIKFFDLEIEDIRDKVKGRVSVDPAEVADLREQLVQKDLQIEHLDETIQEISAKHFIGMSEEEEKQESEEELEAEAEEVEAAEEEEEEEDEEEMAAEEEESKERVAAATFDDGSVLILAVEDMQQYEAIEDEPPTEEASTSEEGGEEEATYDIDPEQFKEAVGSAVKDLKKLFTQVTGKVI